MVTFITVGTALFRLILCFMEHFLCRLRNVWLLGNLKWLRLTQSVQCVQQTLEDDKNSQSWTLSTRNRVMSSFGAARVTTRLWVALGSFGNRRVNWSECSRLNIYFLYNRGAAWYVQGLASSPEFELCQVKQSRKWNATRSALPQGRPVRTLLLPVFLSLSVCVCTGRQKGWVFPKLSYAHKHKRLLLFLHALGSLALFKGVCGVLEGAELAECARARFSLYLWIIAPRPAVYGSESWQVIVDSQHENGLAWILLSLPARSLPRVHACLFVSVRI